MIIQQCPKCNNLMSDYNDGSFKFQRCINCRVYLYPYGDYYRLDLLISINSFINNNSFFGKTMREAIKKYKLRTFE